MRIHSVMYYRSKSDTWTTPWRDKHYRARNLVKALKHKPFGGSSQFKSATGQIYTVDNTANGRKVALAIAAGNIARLIREAGYNSATVVPIPASDHTNPCDDFTCGRLAATITELDASLAALPALYFDEALPSSSAGGGRSPFVIRNHLRGGNAVQGKRHVVLLDDVFTTGAHMRAAARYLRNLGVEVEDGFVLARTTWDEPDDMFECDVEELDTHF